jgi:hypothetical protein
LAEARRARWLLGSGLIATQIAVALVLLVGPGLFGRTLLRLYAIETGFDPGNVLPFDVNSAHGALHGPDLSPMETLRCD